jgi:hypothetical protein
MGKLIYVKQNEIEIAFDEETGEQYITIAGYCRLTGKANATIRQRCRRMIAKKRQNPKSSKITAKPFCWSDAMRSIQLDTGRGVFRTLLISMDDVAIWIKKDNPELADEIAQLIAAFKAIYE